MTLSVKKYILFLFSLLFFISSCKDNNPSVLLLKQAENESFTNPSFAITLLDSIENPETMNKKDYMLYIVTLVQAKYNNNQDITGDTLIVNAQNYFNDKNEPQKAALANFYAGTVYWAKDMPDKALKSFLFAEEYAREAKNKELEAKSLHSLGYLYFKENVLDSAIFRYQKALKCYDNEPGSEANKLMAISGIGKSYEIKDELDSAYFYFNKAMNLADSADNKNQKAIQAYNIGFVLFRKNEYDKAKSYFDDAIQQTTSTRDSLKIFLNYSLLYNKIQQSDSAKYYIELINKRLPEITDNSLLESIYGSMSEYYSQIGNHEQALSYKDMQMKVSQKITDSRSTEKILNSENKYKQYIEKQQRKAERKYYLLVQFFVIIAVIAVFYFFNIKKRHKNQKRLIENRKLKAENRLLKLEHDNHIYLESIYHQYILKWAKIENKVNKLGLEEQQIDLPLYSEIKSMSDELKSYSNKQLVNLSKSYLHSHSDIGEKAVRVLTDQELILMILCYFEYSRVAIATILDIKLEKLDLEERKSRIAARLKKAGMRDYDINVILYSEKM